MSLRSSYLQRYSRNRPLFSLPIPQSCRLVLVIPAYKEKDVVSTVESVMACDKPEVEVHVMILFNAPDSESQAWRENDQGQMDRINSLRKPAWLSVECQRVCWPQKKAGVGTARKTLMDEAQRLHESTEPFLIVNLDADCRVSPDYFCTVWAFAKKQEGLDAFTIGFAHPLETDAIIEYELHLRYYRMIQEWCGLPYAYHTVGSAMAVWSDAYCRQGGMPRRKAGEDFYFLHKFSRVSRLGSLEAHLVFPSARLSDRVPFGTGRAMMHRKDGDPQRSIHPRVVDSLSEWVNFLNTSYHEYDLELLNDFNKLFFKNQTVSEWIEECRKHTADEDQYKRRMYQYFDPFVCMKYFHFLRDNGLPDQDIKLCASAFLSRVGRRPGPDSCSILLQYRSLDHHGGILTLRRKCDS